MSRIEKIVLISFLVLLPSQLGLHFWPSWSYVSNIRIDHLSPTLYFTDLLLLLLLLTSRHLPRISTGIFVFSAINIYFSISPQITFFAWIRLFEVLWLYSYLTHHSKILAQTINSWFPLALIWTTILAWWQFIRQSSIGGLWYWLGERNFNLSTVNIAKLQFFDQGLTLRPYSTFSHPNTLAGFLLVSVLIIFGLARRTKLTKIQLLTIVLVLITIPITFSRSVIALELVSILVWLLIHARLSLIAKSIVSAILVLAITLIIPLGNPNSLSERFILLSKAWHVVSSSPLLGIGLGSFISYEEFILPNVVLPLKYQPVHNQYLLLLSEVGLIGVLYFLSKSKKLFSLIIQSRSSHLMAAVLVVALTGLIDHYWITSHQTLLLLPVLFSTLKNERHNET